MIRLEHLTVTTFEAIFWNHEKYLVTFLGFAPTARSTALPSAFETLLPVASLPGNCFSIGFWDRNVAVLLDNFFTVWRRCFRKWANSNLVSSLESCRCHEKFQVLGFFWGLGATSPHPLLFETCFLLFAKACYPSMEPIRTVFKDSGSDLTTITMANNVYWTNCLCQISQDLCSTYIPSCIGFLTTQATTMVQRSPLTQRWGITLSTDSRYSRQSACTKKPFPESLIMEYLVLPIVIRKNKHLPASPHKCLSDDKVQCLWNFEPSMPLQFAENFTQECQTPLTGL